jgi:hypothetical protein
VITFCNKTDGKGEAGSTCQVAHDCHGYGGESTACHVVGPLVGTGSSPLLTQRKENNGRANRTA